MVVTVQRWSGREARLLRDALRMSLRDFAAYLGVSDRTVSNWEAGGAATSLAPSLRAFSTPRSVAHPTTREPGSRKRRE